MCHHSVSLYGEFDWSVWSPILHSLDKQLKMDRLWLTQSGNWKTWQLHHSMPHSTGVAPCESLRHSFTLKPLQYDYCVMSCNHPQHPPSSDGASCDVIVHMCDVMWCHQHLPEKVCLNSESTRVDLPQPVSPVRGGGREKKREGEGWGWGEINGCWRVVTTGQNRRRGNAISIGDLHIH